MGLVGFRDPRVIKAILGHLDSQVRKANKDRQDLVDCREYRESLEQ